MGDEFLKWSVSDSDQTRGEPKSNAFVYWFIHTNWQEFHKLSVLSALFANTRLHFDVTHLTVKTMILVDPSLIQALQTAEPVLPYPSYYHSIIHYITIPWPRQCLLLLSGQQRTANPNHLRPILPCWPRRISRGGIGLRQNKHERHYSPYGDAISIILHVWLGAFCLVGV